MRRKQVFTGATEAAPKFRDPGPALNLADVPGMPAEAATYFKEKGILTLADLRPLTEAEAAADPTCEPAFVIAYKHELSDVSRYRFGDALIKLFGGRVHMLKVMAGWPAPSAPELPPPPAPVDDFDESTPPPKRRPPGEPIPRRVILPPGEDIVGIFAQWDREGRIPAGAVLCQFIPITGTASKCRLLATSGANPFSVQSSAEIPSAETAPWVIAAELLRQGLWSQTWLVLSPRKGRV